MGDDALALLAQVVREGSFVALDVKAELHRVYPADTAEPALVSDGEVLSADGFDLSVAGYVLNSSLSAYTYDSLMEARGGLHFARGRNRRRARGHPRHGGPDC